jgi:hypothetical protein
MADFEKFLGKMCFVKLKSGDNLVGFLRKPDLFDRIISLGYFEFVISVTDSENYGCAGFRRADVDYFFELVQKPEPMPLIENGDEIIEPTADEINDVAEVKSDETKGE